MKKEFKKTAVVAASVMAALALAAPAVASAATIQESEPNNGMSTSNALELGSGARGTIASVEDSDVFAVQVPKSMTVKVSLTNEHSFTGTSQYGSSSYLGALVYDETGSNRVREIKHKASELGTSSDTIRLNPGTNYIVVVGSKSSIFSGAIDANHPYSIKVSPFVESTRVSKLCATSGGAKMKWMKVADASRYQVRYSTSKNMAKAKTIVTKKTYATLTKLKPGKAYYVQVRGCTVVNGKEYSSSWTSKMTVKAK